MLKYGTTSEDLDLISFKNHQNAMLNPYAHFNNKNVTMEMIKTEKISEINYEILSLKKKGDVKKDN